MLVYLGPWGMVAPLEKKYGKSPFFIRVGVPGDLFPFNKMLEL